MANRDQDLSPSLVLQLTNINSGKMRLKLGNYEDYLHTAGRNIPDERQRSHFRVLQVQVFHLEHHLSDDIVAAISVKAQHHEVECEDLNS